MSDRNWVIWSTLHSAWWGPDRGGYFTSLVGGAGLYTEAEAKEIADRSDASNPAVAEPLSKYAETVRTYARRAGEMVAALDPVAICDFCKREFPRRFAWFTGTGDEKRTFCSTRCARGEFSIETDNHHNALKCPYCNPKGLVLAEPTPADGPTMPVNVGRTGTSIEDTILQVPMWVFEPWADQAERNHGQTLERLRSRGGLGASEAIAILTGTEWKDMLRHESHARLVRILNAAMRYRRVVVAQ